MLRLYRQNPEAIPDDPLGDEYVKGDGQRVLRETDLDGRFPIACRTDQNLVVRVGDQDPRGGAPLGVVRDEPQECVGVQKQPHGMYSSKSFKCSSSSTARTIIPLQLPGTRGFWSE